jgi:hypothetical protein
MVKKFKFDLRFSLLFQKLYDSSHLELGDRRVNHNLLRTNFDFEQYQQNHSC